MKIIFGIAQTYFYVYANFGPFIFVRIVSLLLIRPLNYKNSLQLIMKFKNC